MEDWYAEYAEAAVAVEVLAFRTGRWLRVRRTWPGAGETAFMAAMAAWSAGCRSPYHHQRVRREARLSLARSGLILSSTIRSSSGRSAATGPG